MSANKIFLSARIAGRVWRCQITHKAVPFRLRKQFSGPLGCLQFCQRFLFVLKERGKSQEADYYKIMPYQNLLSERF